MEESALNLAIYLTATFAAAMVTGLVVDAVRCAIAVQSGMALRNSDVPQERRIIFRVGINLGDIVVEDDDILGDGVNIAARIEGIAEPGGICVSRVVRDQVRDRLDVAFEDMGDQSLKNIARPVRVFCIRFSEAPAALPEPASLLLPDKPSIAVLPFQNMSGDPEQEYFADGMVEEITTALSRIRWLSVRARNSSFTCGRVIAGTSTRWWCGSPGSGCICGVPSTTKARSSTCWFSLGATVGRCCG